jgi:hypothetical protein
MPIQKFEDAITEVIGRSGQSPADTESGFFDPSDIEAVRAARLSDLARKLPIQETLERLSEETLRKLLSVMYAGRDHDNDISAIHRAMLRNKPTREDVIRTLLEKPGLAHYLVNGWETLLNSGLDPEGSFRF